MKRNEIDFASKEMGNLISLSRICDTHFARLFAGMPSDITVQDYIKYKTNLQQAIESIHSSKEYVHTIGSTFDKKDNNFIECIHLQYRSILDTIFTDFHDIKQNKGIFFSPRTYQKDESKKEILHLLTQFSNSTRSYSQDAEILPFTDCEICSIIFNENAPKNSSTEFHDDGAFCFDGKTIKLLTETLVACDFKSWSFINEKEKFKTTFERFKKLVEDETIASWERSKAKFRKRYGILLPGFEDLFKLALHSSKNTLQIINEELLKNNPFKLPEAIRYRRSLRRVLSEQSNFSGIRSLCFIPIRLFKNDKKHYPADISRPLTGIETVGLVAFYTSNHIHVEKLIPVALAERLIFSSLRHYEIMIFEELVKKLNTEVRLRTIYSQRLAHSLKYPFEGIIRTVDEIKKSINQVNLNLRDFTYGNFDRLRKIQKIEIYKAFIDIEGKMLADIENKNINYSNWIKRRIFMRIDVQDFNFILEILFDNAIKYCEKEITIRAALEKDIYGMKYICIFFLNDGKTISNEKINTLFSEPVSLPNKRITPGRGFHVGLYMAQYFANANSGYITYEKTETGLNLITLKLPYFKE